MMIAKLVNTCVFYFSYFSSTYQSSSSQYFKIIGVYFLGNVFKNCSNISYIFFSLSRYASVSLEKNGFLFAEFNRIKIKLYFGLVLLLSGVLSIFILFQYGENEYRDYRKEFPYEKRNEEYCLEISNQFTCKLFSTFKIANQLLNGGLIFVLNLIIDVMLFKSFGKEMSTKSRLDLNKEKRQDFKLIIKKSSKMILINNCLYFISYVPALVITLLLVIYSKRIVKFCIAIEIYLYHRDISFQHRTLPLI